MQACGLLLKQMPIYADLIAPCNTSEKGRICTRWEHDLALAAEMQFRMHLLGPCTPSLQEVRGCKPQCSLEGVWPAIALEDVCAWQNVIEKQHSRKALKRLQSVMSSKSLE